MSEDLRLPVIVGAGQLRANRERTVEGAREPLHLLVEALTAAGADAGAPELLHEADSAYAVHVASWAYDDLARRVASAVGASPAHCVDTGLGGHLPVRLLDAAAARIAAGDSEVALLVGGEAQASVTLLGRSGVDPVTDRGWSAAPGGPPAFDLDQLCSPAMQAAGLMAPARVYPLYENRLQADLGLTPDDAAGWSARLYADLSRIAAQHPAAWSTEPRSAQDVATVTPANRMVCEPYPLSMNAMPHVDQAAALVVTSLGTARAHGIADDAMVHVWGGAGVDDDPDVLRRTDFGSSSALSAALDRCLSQASTTVEEVDLVDVYSCFPVVPKLASLHLGLPRDAPLSVTGGHSSFGGPLNSYALHALATMATRLRAGDRVGLVHGNGGYLTSSHAVLLARHAHADGYVGRPEPAPVAAAGAVAVLPLSDAVGAGGHVDVVVETATVEHDRGGAPSQAFVVARTHRGDRVAAATPAGDRAAAQALSLSALPRGRVSHVGREVRLHLQDGGAVTVERR